MFSCNLLHPERYQGARRKAPYFEGWYYKLVDASGQHRYAVIPGIYKEARSKGSQAFIQFMDGISGQVIYYRYPVTAFRFQPDDFEVHVGDSRFAQTFIELHLDGPEKQVHGALRFTGVKPWPVTLLSPGIMGWYAWVPFMECYHGIVSLDHAIEGTLDIDGVSVNMTGGRGYTEKDWGRRFPAAWVWFQSNHLAMPGTSITASVAVIPWLRSAFRGFIIGVWHDGTLYRFATYTGAKIERVFVDDGAVVWVVSDQQHRLVLDIARRDTGQLYAPDISDMSGRVGETMQASAQVSLFKVDDKAPGSAQPIFQGNTQIGALEVVGDMGKLTDS